MISLTIDDKRFQKDMDRFIKKNGKNLRHAITSSTNEMHRAAKKNIRNQTMNSKVKSGFLLNHIFQTITNKGLTGEVRSEASYSEAVEKGTKPHTIKARNKKVLAGPARGAPAGWKTISGDYAIYGKEVKHPGTSPKPFMYPAWRWGCQRFEKLIKAAL